MPKPCLLRRPSGLFVRFLLPADIQAKTRTRFIVRTLKGLRGDRARWVAAELGYALAHVIENVRTGKAMAKDLKHLVDAAVSASLRGEIERYELSIPGVVSLRADGPDDHNRAMEALAAMRIQLPPGLLPTRETTAAPQPDPFSAGPMLHASIDTFLKQFATQGRAAATVLETNNTLKLFRDLTDDVRLMFVGSAQLDGFRDALAHWPIRAGVLPEFKGSSAREIVAKGRQLGGPRISPRTLEKHLDRLRVFFNWALQRAEIARNPLTGIRIQTPSAKYESSRRGFTPEEFGQLFNPVHREKHCGADPIRFWFPLLALFTGARVGELAHMGPAFRRRDVAIS